jgi:hypothetical protein
LSIDVEGLRALHTLLGFNLGLLVFVVALSFLEDGKELLALGIVSQGWEAQAQRDNGRS